MIQTDKIDADQVPDETIKRAARARRYGVYNDRLLYACVERYMEMRAEVAAKRTQKPQPPKADAI